MTDYFSKNSDSVSAEIDPEIADLMGIEVVQEDNAPDFSDLFGEAGGADTDISGIGRESFPEISKFEDSPKPYFRDANYYKIAIAGEGDLSKKVHELLTRFLKAEESQDRSMYRGKLVPAYWDLASSIASRILSALPEPKVLLLRFGILLPTLISAEQRKMISSVFFENTTGEPVHYVDEWLKMIASGKVSVSATDETKAVKRDPNQGLSIKLAKVKGQYDAHLGLLKSKMAEISSLENQLVQLSSMVQTHSPHGVYRDLKVGYSPEQRSALNDIAEITRKLSSADREVENMFKILDSAAEQLSEIEEKAGNLSESAGVDDQALTKEYNTIRQMAKLCIGRQGNHFPILMKQYFRPNIQDTGVREVVIKEMAAVEALDPGLFERTFKKQTSRIVPDIILIPCFGDRGICWEPFDRFNKATSRGRVAIPIFPKEIRTAVLYALGDLRWQVAKEKAQHYWMEEGLTGKYYQYFTDSKLKGDVKETFIQDYILWISKESEGTQKLTRDARGVFWRNIPFPDSIRENLKNRGFVYSELYKKDGNKALSDGY